MFMFVAKAKASSDYKSVRRSYGAAQAKIHLFTVVILLLRSVHGYVTLACVFLMSWVQTLLPIYLLRT
jgi:hypothetical protein